MWYKVFVLYTNWCKTYFWGFWYNPQCPIINIKATKSVFNFLIKRKLFILKNWESFCKLISSVSMQIFKMVYYHLWKKNLWMQISPELIMIPSLIAEKFLKIFTLILI